MHSLIKCGDKSCAVDIAYLFTKGNLHDELLSPREGMLNMFKMTEACKQRFKEK